MIYFDNSATTKPYKEVLDSFVKVSSDYYGNPSSLNGLGSQAEALLSQAREQIASLLNVQKTEILFTSGGTEGNNLAIKGTALQHKRRGRHIITTTIEHPSVSKAMEQLSESGFEISYIPVNKQGVVNIDAIKKAIRNDTILISIMLVNNEVGSIQPIKEIGQHLKNYPQILFHVDAVQGIGKVDLNFHDFGIDLCSISAHKFNGLKGTGALFIKHGIKIAPILSGGDQELSLRSGTENVAGAVSMARALRMTFEKRDAGIRIITNIQKMIYEGLSEVDGIQINTSLENACPHILNFSIPGMKAEVIIHSLEQEGIYVSTTSACSSKKKSPSKTLLAMGVPISSAESSIRISLSFDNTEEEAKIVIQTVKKVIKQLRKVMN